ncbi:50S ribosomal protein L31 [Patescibacteria group bacterium]|nr:50S ribosomal protein L31 [Patescibacteria group bacterium]
MKAKIHPKYHEGAVVTCACGNNFIVGSTEKEIRVELCNMCHPFYTGKQKFVDTARRVEKFQEKMGKVKAVAAVRKGKKAKKVAKAKKADDTVKKEKKEKKEKKVESK